VSLKHIKQDVNDHLAKRLEGVKQSKYSKTSAYVHVLPSDCYIKSKSYKFCRNVAKFRYLGM